MQAYNDIQQQKEKLKKILSDDVKHFRESVFCHMTTKAAIAKTTIAMPRICGRQTLRKNYPANTAEEYY